MDISDENQLKNPSALGPLGTSPRMKKSHFLFYLLFLLLLIIIALVCWYVLPQRPLAITTHPQTTTLVMLRGDSGDLWYQLSGTVLTSVSGPGVSIAGKNAFSVVEGGSVTLPIGTPVIVSLAPGTPPALVGLVFQNGEVSFPVNDPTEKRGLAVRADGLVAFSFSNNPISSSSWHIGVINLASASSTVKDLGQGYGPAFAANGDILALNQQGLVEINPETGAETLLMKLPNDFSQTFAIAPDASFVVFKDLRTNMDDVFWINSVLPTDMSYAGSLPVPFAVDVIGDSFIAQTDATHANLYSVSRSSIHLTSALTIASRS